MHSACLALCLLCLVPFTMACYIQNCPLGGKRSIMDTQMRQCLPCGPDDRGRCFGPRICCGRDIGCYVGTAETLGCRGENYLPSPCEPAGRPCGSERGKCASPGICCDDGESICPHSPALARKDLKATEGPGVQGCQKSKWNPQFYRGVDYKTKEVMLNLNKQQQMVFFIQLI
uniref:Oxytocin n=1 Tax=Callorhinchus milii TaxID=7868 RepID=A0A4W3J3X6_CALMI